MTTRSPLEELLFGAEEPPSSPPPMTCGPFDVEVSARASAPICGHTLDLLVEEVNRAMADMVVALGASPVFVTGPTCFVQDDPTTQPPRVGYWLRAHVRGSATPLPEGYAPEPVTKNDFVFNTRTEAGTLIAERVATFYVDRPWEKTNV